LVHAIAENYVIIVGNHTIGISVLPISWNNDFELVYRIDVGLNGLLLNQSSFQIPKLAFDYHEINVDIETYSPYARMESAVRAVPTRIRCENVIIDVATEPIGVWEPPFGMSVPFGIGGTQNIFIGRYGYRVPIFTYDLPSFSTSDEQAFGIYQGRNEQLHPLTDLTLV